MNKGQETLAVIALVQNHFSIPDNELPAKKYSNNELEEKLARVISTLLNQNMERLLHAFYRIDLNEQIFKKIITEEAPEKISLRLAQEVIEREIQKVRTREKYKAI